MKRLAAAVILFASVLPFGPLPIATAGARERPTCNGRPATIVGTKGQDRLRGTSGRDVIVGRGGRDLILGGKGNDVICGGADALFYLSQKPGSGNDVLRGGPGIDQLLGGDGADRIYAGAGRGAAPAYEPWHRIRAESLFGGTGPDVLKGENGSDWLFGEGGADLMHGGADEDIAFFFFQGSSPDKRVIADLVRGRASGEGDDRLIKIEDLGSNADGHTLKGNARANKLFDSVEGVGNDDVLVGRGGKDVLLASRGSDTARGGAGNDVIGFLECDCGGDSNDRLVGGPGIDTIDYSLDPRWQFAVTINLASRQAEGEAINFDSVTGIENIVGTTSADEIAGNDHANHLVGGMGDDVLYGNGGDDLLDGEDGTDSVDGGTGLDTCLNGESLTDCEA